MAAFHECTEGDGQQAAVNQHPNAALQAHQLDVGGAAVFFEEDENYWVCVDDRGETIDTPQVELRKMAQDIE